MIGMGICGPSSKSMVIATSGPTWELGLCPKAAITTANGDKATSHWQVRRKVLPIAPSLVRPRPRRDRDLNRHGEQDIVTLAVKVIFPRPSMHRSLNPSKEHTHVVVAEMGVV